MRFLRTLVALFAAGAAQAAEVPEVGTKAPAFSLMGSDGKTYRLADYVGQREIVLAWFPKAFTPG